MDVDTLLSPLTPPVRLKDFSQLMGCWLQKALCHLPSLELRTLGKSAALTEAWSLSWVVLQLVDAAI